MTERLKIISGGQTGVDRAALDAAIEAGLPHGGTCPVGRAAEDGVIDDRYDLIETESADPIIRTRLNIADADATLILAQGDLTGGTRQAAEYVEHLGRALLIVDPFADSAAEEIGEWLSGRRWRILSIGGPRESEHPGIYEKARGVLGEVFARLP